MRDFVVGITGASGAVYARRLLERLTQDDADAHVHLVISPHGRRILADELGLAAPSPTSLVGAAADRVTAYDCADVGCVLASGSFRTDGMVICPCSSNTLASVAAGLADNLITRAAYVTLKERRRLVLLHREMPVTAIDLRNMLEVSRAGAIVCPASPGFYHGPQSVEDLVDFVVGRLLDLLGVRHGLDTRWSGAPPRRLGPERQAGGSS